LGGSRDRLMKLSVIIPAYNEAKRIESCLHHLIAGLRANARPGLESEIIVLDNNSTDATAELARQMGARIVFEPVNQIARARNAGAAAASGDWLLFVDADTLVSSATLAEMLALVEAGNHAGGASIVRFDKPDFFGKVLIAVSNPIVRALKLTCGCFIFCRTDAFRALGGFDQNLFAGEDADFGQRLKRWARDHRLRVGILHAHPPVTSIRKIELYGWKEVIVLLARWLLLRRRTTRDKKCLHLFYDGRR
jgi:glycosyltransferase involved in cell wall biosynthesis